MLGEEMDMVKVIVVDYGLVGWRALKSILLTIDGVTIQNYQRDALNIIYSSNIITLLYMFRVSNRYTYVTNQ